MAITTSDLKLMQAERNTDNDDGGGMMTGTPLVSGDINNLWDDVDSTEQARGGVSIRRVFPAVRTTNTDKLLGARVAITEDAAASNISTLLYQTGDHYAERSQVQSEIESYVVIGTQSPLRPVGTQREGQNAVILYSDKLVDAPAISQTIVLEDTETDARQFVKITDVETVRTSYTYSKNGEFESYSAYQHTCALSQELSQDFEGSDPSPAAEHTTRILTTQTSNSARYYGLSPLSVAAADTDTSIKVEAIQAPIVPTATTETAIVDQTPGIETRYVQSASDDFVDFSLGTHSGATVLTLPLGWVPGTLSLTIGTAEYVDVGAELQLVSGTSKLNSATVDAATGRITLDLVSSNSISASIRPGAALTVTPFTESVEITSVNRQITYTHQLSPIPAPGTLRVEFLYNGEWATATDDGSGAISGDGITGNVNYNTGSLSLVLPGEPDEGSHILYTWATSVYDSLNADDMGDVALAVPMDQAVETGSLVVNWSRGNNHYTLSQNVDGTFSGDGNAEIANGAVHVQPSALPDGPVTLSGTELDGAARAVINRTLSEQSGTTITISTQANISPGSVKFTAWFYVEIINQADGQQYTTRSRFSRRFRGDSTGNLIKVEDGYGYTTAGTIDPASGDIEIDLSVVQQRVTEWIRSGHDVTRVISIKVATLESQSVDVTVYGALAGDPFTSVAELSDISVRIPFAHALVPGAQLVTLSGQQLVDRGDGVIYRNWTAETAAGLQVGQINHQAGLVELDYSLMQSVMSNLTATVIAGTAVVATAVPITETVFRTAAAPLRSNGFTLQARRSTDTALATATADITGQFSDQFDTDDVLDEIPRVGVDYNQSINRLTTSAGSVSGTVDYQTGLVTVTASQPVLISTLSYSAVAYTSVPLDPDLIGLDPVKLPTNGQVPMFKPGYLVLIHHTDTIEITTPVAGQQIDCGRADLAVARIKDAAGAELATDQYSVDKSTGLVTLADPFSAVDADSNTLTLPLTLSHRVQDICGLSRVLVDGTLNLMTQLTHDYPIGSVCSSVVVLGSLQARVENLFSQKVDSNDFADELQGDASVAQYDDLNYPIQIDNLGAVQEKWKIRWTDATNFDLLGEQRGLVASGTRDADFSPINPMTNTPYFTLLAAGNGTGWVSGNITRFDTMAAAEPVEAIRTTLPSHEKLSAQSVHIEFMGDAD